MLLTSAVLAVSQIPCTPGLPKGMDARSWRDGADAPHSPLLRASWLRARRRGSRGFHEEDAADGGGCLGCKWHTGQRETRVRSTLVEGLLAALRLAPKRAEDPDSRSYIRVLARVSVRNSSQTGSGKKLSYKTWKSCKAEGLVLVASLLKGSDPKRLKASRSARHSKCATTLM